MANILLVGTATLDLVFRLDHYPQENEEMRAQSLRVCRGGNAANTAVVLAQMGHRCTFYGVLADAPETAIIEQDFRRHAVDCAACPRLAGKPPTSSIYLSGSARTIVHYRDLPELTARQFLSLDLTHYDWVHFEGRNVPELLTMLAHVRHSKPTIPLSLELEKRRPGLEAVLPAPTLLICAQGYARQCGYTCPRDFLAWLRGAAPDADLVVAWGEDGAYARSRRGEEIHSPAFPPPMGVVDTLGAGDTFNAGLIGALVQGSDLSAAMVAANRLAGLKCGIEGFSLPIGP
ncbi:MAG: PfkB family carbohydrate kinase [Methylophilaceae bacterium]|nr:PfkB family carbohydrate kinase [Methylophilaceae bacterium]